MKRLVASALIVSFLAPTTLFAIDGYKAAYHGGSVGIFASAKGPVEGRLDNGDPDVLVLRMEGPPFAGQELRIPYAKIEHLEYGQEVGRSVGAAIRRTALFGTFGLLTFFSKKRNRLLTVAYKDEEEKDQVAILELGNEIARATLTIVKTRSGKEITYQDEEARKATGN